MLLSSPLLLSASWLGIKHLLAHAVRNQCLVADLYAALVLAGKRLFKTAFIKVIIKVINLTLPQP